MTDVVGTDRLGGVGAGILLRLTSTGLFAVMSLTVRAASFEAPVGEIVFFRSAFALPVILAWRIASGVVAGLAHVTMTEALVRAPASTLAPFEYTGLLWAATIVAAAAVVAAVEQRSRAGAAKP